MKIWTVGFGGSVNDFSIFGKFLFRRRKQFVAEMVNRWVPPVLFLLRKFLGKNIREPKMRKCRMGNKDGRRRSRLLVWCLLDFTLSERDLYAARIAFLRQFSPTLESTEQDMYVCSFSCLCVEDSGV